MLYQHPRSLPSLLGSARFQVLFLAWLIPCAACLAPLWGQSANQQGETASGVDVRVRQAAGIDSRVDYSSLTRFGPWDDRNYQLTRADVELLSKDDRLDDLIPAFYRVSIRRLFLQRGQTIELYPRSSYPRFLVYYGGFLVDGRLYPEVDRTTDGDYRIIDRHSRAPLEFLMQRAGISTASESRVSTPVGQAESAIAIRPSDPNFVIAGSNVPGSKQQMHFSQDGGATWAEAADLPAGGTCCDPTVAWSSDGTKAYAATLGSGQVLFYRSADNGQTWSDLATEPGGDPRRELGTNTDKEYLHVDTDPGSPYLDTIHLTWHQGNVLQYARSTDFGNTWEPTISFAAEPHGIGSDITTDGNGAVYYLYPNSSNPASGPSDIRLLRSTDGGATFDPSTVVATTEDTYEFKIPIMDTRKTWIYISADADRTNGDHRGNVYAAWTDSTATTTNNAADNHARIRVAVSSDAGVSWTLTTPHETADQNIVDRFHPWLGVDSDGKVHVVYYDTRQNLPGRLATDLYHSVSSDGALTWSAPERLTSVSSPLIANSFEWGDYNGLDIVGNRMLAIYTDNRTEGTETGDSRDVYSILQPLTVSPIFSDGFESGDTGFWTDPLP